ncbi:dynamin family protein [Rivularia sp. UHCC 0363]|uniref:dynamin family protein n=1 Tax=Rivularia sp. UHCC 0363 TaxID=3110244 RepID=UPI002B1F5094|nr:dynamin family protein [Rivularia sp. UHCC 0363]MEA5597109.1 dynamin family protein [Rivularia sp. UHCC 0363]
MLDVLTSIVLEQVVPSVLNELVSIFGEKLRQKLLNPTPEDTTTKVEIEDAVIIEKIERLVEQNEGIQNDIQNSNKTTEDIINQVLREIKILSAKTPELQVVNDQVGLSGAIQEENKEFNLQDVTVLQEKIQKSLKENINKWLAEIKYKPSPQVDNKQDLAPVANEGNGQNFSSDENEEPSVEEAVKEEDSESQKMLDNLYKYKEYGESVLQKIKLLERNKSEENEILNNSELKECLKKIEEAANKTVEQASSPVKIAIMGEFSSGKTQLIESLIGYGGILPVSDIPTTGNVTAIHLIPQDGYKTTEFVNYTVEYLSEQEVQECLQFMLNEARKRAKEAGSELPALPQVNSTTLNQQTPNPFENWCEQAWNKTQNVELRYALRELVIFIRTYISYKADLCGKKLKIAHKTAAYKGLELVSGIPALNQDFKFEDIPLFNKGSVDKNKLSAEVLQNSFSLIRRINIDVKISKEIWNLGTTQDTSKFILLDFPGLGAANSGMRDTFVSLRELKSVQTTLILLNGERPGSGGANKIFTMMEQQKSGQNLKDLILVGVGRFNQLLGADAKIKLGQLINSNVNTTLTEETVLQALNGLGTIINDAKVFTSQPERIVLLDQLMGLGKLAELSGEVEAGSAEFLGKLQDPSFLKESKEISQKWGVLSQRLLEKNSASPLGNQLKCFALDGGIGKLRKLLLQHVAAHGLKQLDEDTHRAANTLGEQQEKLKRILLEQGILEEESQALKDLRSHLGQMYSNYKEFQDNLGKEPLKDWQGIAVSDVVKDEVTYRILDWKQWNLLFSRAQNGIIALPSPNENQEEPFRRRKRPTNNIPTKSDDFYEEFGNTVKGLEEFARKCIKEAVKNLLNNLSNQLDTEIKYLQGILREQMEEDIADKIGEDEADIFAVVYQG